MNILTPFELQLNTHEFGIKFYKPKITNKTRIKIIEELYENYVTEETFDNDNQVLENIIKQINGWEKIDLESKKSSKQHYNRMYYRKKKYENNNL